MCSVIFFLFTLFFVIDATNAAYTQTTDYCDAKLCPRGDTVHIACKNYDEWDWKLCGRSAKIYQMNQQQKNMIVDIHNTDRSTVASGKLKRYDTAAHMHELTWDEELSRLACLNVKKCTTKHDNCFGTVQYKYPGQNLAMMSRSDKFESLETFYNQSHAEWFNEHKSASMLDIDNFSRNPMKPG